ncbi:MAG: invasion associated locus B family protein [Beijerinckiaceae bacterium]|nr:invasion associated locus B family protein [Beijerinckiaceae bacterium]
MQGLKTCAAALMISVMAMGGSAGLVSAQQAQPAAKAKPAAPAAKPATPAAPAPAAAAPAAPAQNIVQLKPDPAQADWLKVCGKDDVQNKQICYTTRDFVADNNQPILALAIYDVVNDPKKFVRFLLPLGFLVQPGVRFGIDAGQPAPGKFSICLPNGCFAEAEATAALIDQLKKGTNLRIQMLNQVGQEVSLVVPLGGFGKAFDGPAVDPTALEAQQKKIQEELQKRAEEQRKQQSAVPAVPGAPIPAPTPAPAPPAPAAPAAPAPTTK